MKKNMKLIFAVGFAVAAFALPCARAASASAAATNTAAKPVDAMTALFGDPVIAKGKGFEIKRSELDQVMTGIKSAAAARGQSVPPAQLSQIEGQLLSRLIQVQVLLQKATAADKSNGVQKADQQLKALQERAGSQEVLDRQLKAVGMTQADLRAKVVQESTAQAVLARDLNVSVTDAEVKKFYDDHPADFEQPEMAHVRHILLMTMDPVTRAPLTADQQKAKQKQAEDLLKRVRGGADFAALAKQYSEDPGSKDNGGEMPAFPKGQMVPEFEAAAFSLTNNQVSDIVTSTYGYHIIKAIDNKTPAKKLTMTDKVPPGDATIASKIKDYLEQQKSEKLAPAYLDKMKQAAEVQVLDPDLKAAMAAAAAAAAAAPAAPPEQ
jgi:parvulin-like peptidyl-prolyl isomerase